jgi:hypothetical protein
VLIGIQHFSKWCEVWALPIKQSTKVAEAFLGVTTRYGACAELLTDNRQEFAGEVYTLCQRLLVTHRTTLRYHPQSNGLTERHVKTIKGGITRFKLGTEADRRTWDVPWLLYLVMGYRMSNQAALGGYFPYFVLHGRQPMLTGQTARQLLEAPIDFDSPEQWVKACEQRSEVLKKEMPLALGNLLAAQQRDQQRYETVRKASYRPRERKFLVGDLRRQPSDSTDVSVSRGAYRVHQVGANGRMVLQGADGMLFKEHLENCAPCHNPNIDLTVDPSLTTVPASHPCPMCRSTGNLGKMLLCDYCLEGWHMGAWSQR